MKRFVGGSGVKLPKYHDPIAIANKVKKLKVNEVANKDPPPKIIVKNDFLLGYIMNY